MSIETAGQFDKTTIKTNNQASQQKSLFSPLIDFLCLGGGFLVILLPILLFLPTDDKTIATFGVIFLIVANFINHPHFFHSYQIFYQGFQRKALSDTSPLKQKYIFAGIMIPAVMIVFFSYCLFAADFILLGYAGNLMAFLVGWHYAKQGYGMLMVSAVLKRNFFNDSEKRILLINSYLVWVFSWILTNQIISERELWGIEYFTFSVPGWALWSIGSLMIISSIFVGQIFIRRALTNYTAFPKNGAIAYLTSLYIWMIAIHIHPALALCIPAFHSLQYLVVIWRFEINKSTAEYNADKAAKIDNPRSLNRRLFIFGTAGIIFGSFGFWLFPIVMDFIISRNIEGLSNTAFIFMFWIFINIHHYFIDNVIWRKENTEVSKYLFS